MPEPLTPDDRKLLFVMLEKFDFSQADALLAPAYQQMDHLRVGIAGLEAEKPNPRGWQGLLSLGGLGRIPALEKEIKTKKENLKGIYEEGGENKVRISVMMQNDDPRQEGPGNIVEHALRKVLKGYEGEDHREPVVGDTRTITLKLAPESLEIIRELFHNPPVLDAAERERIDKVLYDIYLFISSAVVDYHSPQRVEEQRDAVLGAAEDARADRAKILRQRRTEGLSPRGEAYTKEEAQEFIRRHQITPDAGEPIESDAPMIIQVTPSELAAFLRKGFKDLSELERQRRI